MVWRCAVVMFVSLSAGALALIWAVLTETGLGTITAAVEPASRDAALRWLEAALGSGAAAVQDGQVQSPYWILPLFFAGLVCLWRLRKPAAGALSNHAEEERAAVAVAPSNHDEADDEPAAGRSALSPVLRACSGAFMSVGLFSALVNILMLTGALFMLEVYDRVLPSRSVPTLAALGLLAFVLFNAQILLDIIRNRILVRIGSAFNAMVGPRAFAAQVQLPLIDAQQGEQSDPVRELDTVRAFLSSPGPVVLFDLPWMPFYLAVIYLMHPWLGMTAIAGAVVLAALALATELATRRPARLAAHAEQRRSRLAESARRNAETVSAMGMIDQMGARWDAANQSYLQRHNTTSDVTGGLGSTAKGLRLMLQAIVLAVGAYLVIAEQASAGVIIASAILVNRALAPVDLAIGQWKGFVTARQAWRRLDDLLARIPASQDRTELPAPSKSLTVERVSLFAPDNSRLILRDVRFSAEAGQGIGLVGPSGSGKSSLVRMIVGAGQPVRGKVMLDGAALMQWPAAERGRHIGYLSQNVELMPGTVAQNIARFDPEATSEAIVKAAQSAGVHDLILGLADGYETDVGLHGETLSVGQRQRVALARALYGEPFLIVLDEPNSNLDAEGDAALNRAILQVRLRGGIVIVVAHRPSALASINRIVALHDGRVIADGDRDDVIAELRGRARPAAKPSSDEPEKQEPSRHVAEAG